MDDKELYLHIGRHKTGTSALQHFLQEQRDSLAVQGVCYPRTGSAPGRNPSHVTIARALHHDNKGGRLALLLLRRRFEEEIRPHSRVICSSEGLQNILSAERLNFFFRRGPGDPLLDLAGRVFRGGRNRPRYHVRTLCYLREFLDYARSAYAQRVQASGLFCGFDAFCQGFSGFDFERFLGFWRGFSDATEFLSYERTLEKPGGIVGDFLERLGLRLPVEASGTGDKNPTISGNLLAFKLAVNRHFPHSEEYYLVLRRLAGAEARFRGPFRIPQDTAAMLRERHRDYNATLRRTVGDFPERDFSQCREVFDARRWPEDVERILGEPEMEPLRRHAEAIRDAARDLPGIGF